MSGEVISKHGSVPRIHFRDSRGGEGTTIIYKSTRGMQGYKTTKALNKAIRS